MSDATPLTRTLLRFFSRDAGALADTLHRDDLPKVHKALHKRADKLLEALDGDTWKDAHTRRGALLFRLLELSGDDFPQAWDRLLLKTLASLKGEPLVVLGPHLIALFDTLPEARREPLRAFLLQKSIHRCPYEGNRRLIPAAFEAPLIKEARRLVSLLEAARAQGRSHHIEPGLDIEVPEHEANIFIRTGDRLAVPFLFQFLADLDPETAPTPLCEDFLSGILERQAASTFGPRPEYPTLIAWLPEARREALLLRFPAILWSYAHLCPTPALLRAAVTWTIQADQSTVGRVSAAGEEARPYLIEGIIDAPVGAARSALWKRLREMLAPEAVPACATMLRSDDPDERAQAAHAMALIGPEECRDWLAIAFAEGSPEVRRESARVLAAWALISDQSRFIDARLAAEGDPDTRDMLGLAARNAALSWAEAIERFRAWRTASTEDPWPPLRQALDGHDENIKVSRLWALWPHNKALMEALRQHWPEPVSIIAGLSVHTHFKKAHHGEYLDWLRDIYGSDLLFLAVEAWLIGEDLRPNAALYRWLCAQGGGSLALHASALEASTKTIREGAAQALVALGEDAIEVLIPLLDVKNATLRQVSARCLGLIGHRRTLEALREAEGRERTRKVKEALSEALAACDPFLKSLSADTEGTLGIYTRAEPLDLNLCLEQLRAVLYEDPSAVSWTQLWDIVARFRTLGALDLALDYLGEDPLAHWPQALHAQVPWRPTGDPLDALLPSPSPDAWIPIHTLHTPRGVAWMERALNADARLSSARRLTLAGCDIFLDTVERAWRWCEAEKIALAMLEIRADGGALHKNYAGRAMTTSIVLKDGFGATISRTTARKSTGFSEGEGLRFARLRLPADHRLRLLHKVSNRIPCLDLGPLL